MRDWPVDPEQFSHLVGVLHEHASPEALDRLAAIIDGLEPKQRFIVNALCYEGLSRREVGRQLNLHRRTVQRLFASACEVIRVAMGWSTDAGYQARKEMGLLESPDDYLSAAELAATMGGRVRGDGRRLDSYAYKGRWD